MILPEQLDCGFYSSHHESQFFQAIREDRSLQALVMVAAMNEPTPRIKLALETIVVNLCGTQPLDELIRWWRMGEKWAGLGAQARWDGLKAALKHGRWDNAKHLYLLCQEHHEVSIDRWQIVRTAVQAGGVEGMMEVRALLKHAQNPHPQIEQMCVQELSALHPHPLSKEDFEMLYDTFGFETLEAAFARQKSGFGILRQQPPDKVVQFWKEMNCVRQQRILQDEVGIMNAENLQTTPKSKM